MFPQLCISIFFSLWQTHRHTGVIHVLLSLFPISDVPFYSSRPTVFLLDDRAATANRLQRQDVSAISRNLTFMGLVFLPHFCIDSFQLSLSLHHTWQLSGKKKFEVLTELLLDLKKSRSEKKGILILLCGVDQICALGDTTGEMCICTCTWLHIAWGRHLCIPPLSASSDLQTAK